MKDIVSIDVDYSQLPPDYLTSQHPEAIKYRRALARASNAIEGVILTPEDKKFMDSIPFDMSDDDFIEALLVHLSNF